MCIVSMSAMSLHRQLQVQLQLHLPFHLSICVCVACQQFDRHSSAFATLELPVSHTQSARGYREESQLESPQSDSELSLVRRWLLALCRVRIIDFFAGESLAARWFQTVFSPGCRCHINVKKIALDHELRVCQFVQAEEWSKERGLPVEEFRQKNLPGKAAAAASERSEKWMDGCALVSPFVWALFPHHGKMFSQHSLGA